MSSVTSSLLDEYTATHVAELFRSFSDTSRVLILSAIIDQERSVTALSQIVGISESAVSHHLRGLRQMRLVNFKREGKEVFYRVDDAHVIELFQQGVRHVQED